MRKIKLFFTNVFREYGTKNILTHVLLYFSYIGIAICLFTQIGSLGPISQLDPRANDMMIIIHSCLAISCSIAGFTSLVLFKMYTLKDKIAKTHCCLLLILAGLTVFIDMVLSIWLMANA